MDALEISTQIVPMYADSCNYLYMYTYTNE